VLAGAAEACVASPSHLLECPDPQALRLVAIVQQASPLLYPVRRSDRIDGFADLRGHAVAVWPGGEDLELRWALHRAGLPANAVQRIPTLDTAAAFRSGEVASCQVTSYHEWHAVAGEDVTALRADDLGCGLVKDGLIVRADLPRPLVQALLDAVLEGWARALESPEDAVEACVALRPEQGAGDQARQLAEIARLIRSGATLTRGLGYPDPLHLERAAAALAELDEPLPADWRDLVDPSFWQAAPRALRPALA
jgi:ABC-type nitrate/sulfonate/bicarbonate transport system substrate-binding protein